MNQRSGLAVQTTWLEHGLVLDRGRAVNPPPAPAHANRGFFLSRIALNMLRLTLPDTGAPHAEEAAKLKPDAPASHVAHAALLGSFGLREEARVALARALRLRPDLDLTVVSAMIPYLRSWRHGAPRQWASH